MRRFGKGFADIVLGGQSLDGIVDLDRARGTQNAGQLVTSSPGMKPGDLVEVVNDAIGVLANRVVAQ
jgi:2-keto-4-pentenoate hydratase/2-oxohepta-3-ene-1,7-dioic acid hydratase in catechol pathway